MKLIIFTLFAFILLAPSSAFAQENTQFREVGRISTTDQGIIFLRNANTSQPWSNGVCTSVFMRIAPDDFDSQEAYDIFYAQLLLAVGTGRTVRFLDVTCPNTASSVRFGGRMESQ